MSDTFIAYGATVERSTNGTDFTPIPECTAVAVPAPEDDFVEVTSLDSPGRSREYIIGLTDNGTITLPANFTPAGYALMLSDKVASRTSPIYYRVTLAMAGSQSVVGDMFAFRGFPNPKLSNGNVAEKVDMSVEIRITGAITYTPGS